MTRSTELANLIKQDDDRTARELSQVFGKAEVEPEGARNAQVAVLIGTYLAETDTGTTIDGDPLNTLWGQMAYQLGGQEAYNVVGEAARQGNRSRRRPTRRAIPTRRACRRPMRRTRCLRSQCLRRSSRLGLHIHPSPQRIGPPQSKRSAHRHIARIRRRSRWRPRVPSPQPARTRLRSH